jgi:hypothetical protein
MIRCSPKRSIQLTAVVLLSSLGCDLSISNLASRPSIRGNGVVVTQERSIEDFDSVEVHGGVRIEISCDAEPELTISGEENLLAIIETTCVDGRLKIRSNQSYSTTQPIKIQASCSQLKRYEGSGATRGTIVEVHSDSLDAQLSGASSLVVQSGRVGTLKGNTSGASTLQADTLQISKAQVATSGASRMALQVAEKLSASASGSSRITYRGSPEIVSRETSGVSSIREQK